MAQNSTPLTPGYWTLEDAYENSFLPPNLYHSKLFKPDKPTISQPAHPSRTPLKRLGFPARVALLLLDRFEGDWGASNFFGLLGDATPSVFCWTSPSVVALTDAKSIKIYQDISRCIKIMEFYRPRILKTKPTVEMISMPSELSGKGAEKFYGSTNDTTCFFVDLEYLLGCFHV